MKKEIFHTIRACGRTFDQKQWFDYCDMIRNDESKRVYNTFGKYTFNDHDICVSPDVEEIMLKGGSCGYYVRINYAECGNGIWVFGLDYSTGTGGGGFGAAWSDKVGDPECWHSGYASKKECLIAACDKALVYLDNSCNVNDDNRGSLIAELKCKVRDYRKSMTRPQVVQLQLF